MSELFAVPGALFMEGTRDVSLTSETLYFLRDQLHDLVLEVSTPDFRHRARLVCDALDELDAAIENLSEHSGDSIARGDERSGELSAHPIGADVLFSSHFTATHIDSGDVASQQLPYPEGSA